MRRDTETTVGEHGVGSGHLPGGYRPGAQGHGQVGRMFVGVETEAGDIVLRVAGTDGLQDTDRNHVFRFHQSGAHAHRAIVLAVVVFRLPGLRAGFARGNHQWFVSHYAARVETFFQGGGIDEGFETRTGLPPGLRDMVEHVAVEVKTTDQGANAAVLWREGDKGGFNFGQLADLPLSFIVLEQAHDRTAAQALVWRRLVVEHAGRKFQAVSAQGDVFAALDVGADLFAVSRQHQGWAQVAGIADVLQQDVDGFVLIGIDVFEIKVGFGAPVAIAPVIIENAFA